MGKKSRKRPPVPQDKQDLRPVDRAFIHSVMFWLGIVPMEVPTINVSRALENLTKEESLSLRRKFRKLWRQAMKEEASKTNGKQRALIRLHILEKQCGLGKDRPSKANMLLRKKIVHRKIWYEKIVPLLEKFLSSEIHTQEEG